MSQCRLAIELRTCFLSRGESTRGTHAVESVGRCLGAGLKPRFNNDQGNVPRAASSGEARQCVESRPFNPTSFTAFPPFALALAICFSYRYPIPHSPPLLILSSWRSGVWKLNRKKPSRTILERNKYVHLSQMLAIVELNKADKQKANRASLILWKQGTVVKMTTKMKAQMKKMKLLVKEPDVLTKDPLVLVVKLSCFEKIAKLISPVESLKKGDAGEIKDHSAAPHPAKQGEKCLLTEMDKNTNREVAEPLGISQRLLDFLVKKSKRQGQPNLAGDTQQGDSSRFKGQPSMSQHVETRVPVTIYRDGKLGMAPRVEVPIEYQKPSGSVKLRESRSANKEANIAVEAVAAEAPPPPPPSPPKKVAKKSVTIKVDIEDSDVIKKKPSMSARSDAEEKWHRIWSWS
ncbi:hypothetical protein MUK42_03600 [Musa troglodytarum]|uniref:Uncharacterized protein n=1 Tax=Musa troglodytarum TaxID=320322 RepID=A0A9E7HLD3_9LILI|nr:hypothetical protein MUK42_03600 [Musa troglodytarum]